MADKPLFNPKSVAKTDKTEKPVEKAAEKPVSEPVSEPAKTTEIQEVTPSGDALEAVPEDMMALLTDPAVQSASAADLQMAATGGAMLQRATPTRVAHPVRPVNNDLDKLMAQRREVEAAMAQLDEEIAEQERAAGTYIFAFVARNPAQVAYVTVRGQEVRCNFVNGAYTTSDEAVAAQLQTLPLFKRGGIRLQPNLRMAHLRQQMAAQRQHLRTATAAGITGSTAGSDVAFQQRDAQLAELEGRLL